jgi:hypothetical protein
MKKLSETYKELGIIAFSFPIEIKDADGNVTYFADSNGYTEGTQRIIMNEERNELSSPSGSGYLDSFPEPEVAYTRHKALSGSFKCLCVRGAWCYANGGKRPCDAGLLMPTHIQNSSFNQ